VTLERRIVVEVPMEPHDRRVDHLATEVGVVAVRQLGDR
jgi:5-formyltetrahydrofolate cyclo-ligase